MEGGGEKISKERASQPTSLVVDLRFRVLQEDLRGLDLVGLGVTIGGSERELAVPATLPVPMRNEEAGVGRPFMLDEPEGSSAGNFEKDSRLAQRTVIVTTDFECIHQDAPVGRLPASVPSEMPCGIGKHIVIVKCSGERNTPIILALCGWHRFCEVGPTRQKAGFFCPGRRRWRAGRQLIFDKKTRVPAGTGTLVRHGLAARFLNGYQEATWLLERVSRARCARGPPNGDSHAFDSRIDDGNGSP